MKWIRSVPLVILCLVMIFLPASSALSVPLGDEVPLAGTSTGSEMLYLFLTGPNLPANGVRLSDGAAVVTGSSSSFTRVEVQTDDTWRYVWDTSGLGGIIDVGSYVVYVVTEPAGKQDLKGIEYATLSITLTRPGISVVTERPPPFTTRTPDIITTPTTATIVPTELPTESLATEPAMSAPGIPVPGIIPVVAFLLVVMFAVLRRG